MNYLFHIIIILNIYSILAVSTNLLVGMTNLLSLGQAAFYGIGAYLSVYAIQVLHLPLLPALLFIIVLTSLISLVIAYPSLRLKGDYFILATLGFQLIISSILHNWTNVTGGPYGISGISAPDFLGIFNVSSTFSFLILSTVINIIIILILRSLINSPFGRVLKALREDEIALSSLGRNVTSYKIFVFIISSGFISTSGLIYSTYMSYIDPGSFNLDQAIFILCAVLIGGTGNIKGPIAGACFVVLLPEIFSFIGFPDNIAANLRQIVYGLSLIILMQYRPQGLAGIYRIK